MASSQKDRKRRDPDDESEQPAKHVKQEPGVKTEPGIKEELAPAPSSSKSNAAVSDVDIKEEEEAPLVEHIADMSHSCPYLDTINRSVLDFDFEKLCSVSMSNQNVYACLVCGKYFQGRGKGTHAYTHSLQAFHHVYLNLSTLKVYCLPDNYEVIDSSLDDIKYVLKPAYSKKDVTQFGLSKKQSRALDGSLYLPGVMGLNNIKANDYVNVVVQSLLRVVPLRDFFLDERNYAGNTDPLVVSFGELVRKVCNPKAFKSHVSPHEFLQAITTASQRQFKLIAQSDPVELIQWLLNALHARLKKGKTSIISQSFQGHMTVIERKLPPTPDMAELAGITVDPNDPQYKEVAKESPFMFLTLDLPPTPLFQDANKHNIIAQVPLFELLNKFDGQTEKEYKTYKDIWMKRFQLNELPDYLIVCIRRFTKNTFFVEKNPTIVNFPVQNIDMHDYLKPKDDAAAEAIKGKSFQYDLVANIVHDGLPGAGKGTYRCHILHHGTDQWYEMQDLHVTETLPQMITLTESYIQIWERQKSVKQEQS